VSDGAAGREDARRGVERVVGESYPRLVAYLASVAGDIAAAEDALGDAIVSALATWPSRGVPRRPDAWLVTAARRNLIDAARRARVADRALPGVAQLREEQAEAAADEVIPDRRLELMFACAHPALAEPMRAPLILQVVLGLDAARIAPAFLMSPATMGQRLVRAKAKIARAGIPFSVPSREELPGRLGAVLDAIYAAYGAGWDDPAGRDPKRRGLTGESMRIARVLADLLPGEPEADGLLALLLHLEARAGARRGADGGFVPLGEQDVARWDAAMQGEAERRLARAQRAGRPGPYQLQAAIQSVHSARAITGATDWTAITLLYEALVARAPALGALVALAAARREAEGPAAALSLLDELPPDAMRAYQPYWVLRAHCRADLGDRSGSEEAARIAIGLTDDPAVRAHLQRRLLPAPWGPAEPGHP